MFDPKGVKRELKFWAGVLAGLAALVGLVVGLVF